MIVKFIQMVLKTFDKISFKQFQFSFPLKRDEDLRWEFVFMKFQDFFSSHPGRGPASFVGIALDVVDVRSWGREGAADQDLFKARTNNKQQIFWSLRFPENNWFSF